MTKSVLLCGLGFLIFSPFCSCQYEDWEHPYATNPRANKTCSVPSHCVVGDASYQEDYCYVTAGGFDDYKNTCCLEDHDAGVSSEQGNFYCFCCSAPCDKEGNCYRYTTKKEIVGDKDFDELELEVIERRKVINRKQYM